jgi:hypothetical protein
VKAVIDCFMRLLRDGLIKEDELKEYFEAASSKLI